jgi:hypothetical protein
MDTITDNVKDLKTILNASYDSNDKAKKVLEDKGYIFDDELSNEKQKVFYDPVTDRPKIVFKGTTTLDEWFKNPLIPFNLEFIDPDIYKTKNLVEEVTKKYDNKPDLYGHSRGATKAVYNSSLANQVYTYNKPSKLYGSYIFKTDDDNVSNYRATFDPVSSLDIFKSKNLGGSILPLKAHSTAIKFV